MCLFVCFICVCHSVFLTRWLSVLDMSEYFVLSLVFKLIVLIVCASSGVDGGASVLVP